MSPDTLTKVRAALEPFAEVINERGFFCHFPEEIEMEAFKRAKQALALLSSEPTVTLPAEGTMAELAALIQAQADRDALLEEAARMLEDARPFVEGIDAHENTDEEDRTGARKFMQEIDALIARLRAQGEGRG